MKGVNFARVVCRHGEWSFEGAALAALGVADFADSHRKWPVGFAIWVARDGVVSAETCPYGVLPVYFYSDEKQIILADRLEPFIRAGITKLDPMSVAVLLRIPFSVNGATPLAGVRRLPPGASLLWRAGKLDMRVQPPPMPETFGGTRAQAVDRYVELFRAAIARCKFLLDDCALPLSGGQDSRHIALELRAQGVKPRFACSVVSQPPSAPSDARIGALVAARLGFPHRAVGQGNPLGQMLRHNKLVDFCSWEHAWLMPMRSATKGMTATDGLAGDILSAALYQDEAHLSLENDPDGLARHMLDLWACEDALLSEEARARFPRTLAFEAIRAELKLHSMRRAREFYLWNRVRCGTGLLPFRILGQAVTPFLEPALFAFLRSLPQSIAGDKSFHADAIRRGYPEFASIPFAEKGTREAPWFNRRLALSLLRYLAPKRRRRWLAYPTPQRLVASILSGRGVWEVGSAVYAAQLSEAFD